MTDPTQSNQPREEQLNELIAEYLRRVDGGEELDPEQFIAPHPEVAESFRQYLQDAAFVDGLKQSRKGPAASQDTAGSSAAEETIPPRYASPGAEPAAEPRQFGRYRLVRLLGQGAMGAVYLAEDPELQRHVALKIPKFLEEEDAAARERFYREARAAAALNHPNICQVHDIGEQDGTPFIAMAYVQGKPLSQFVSGKRQWPERDVAKLVRKIAVALNEAQAKGVIHRDLKPGNIMLDQRHEPIVMDFGLAGRAKRPGEEKLTQSGMLIGTPAYMSPEQARSDFEHVGPSSDIYSLGVICYELLTGEVPFRGPIGAVIAQILSSEPPRPSELRPAIDERLEAICLKMMAKSPEDRYRTGAEVAADLRQFLEETASGRSSRQPAAEGGPEWESRKHEIVGLLQGGQFGPAIEALEKLARTDGPGAAEHAAWARGELARVRALPRELLEKGPAIVETAIDLIASQEYTEAVRLLGAVPEDYRSTEAAKLLDKATQYQQEAEQLNARMHEAVRTRQYEGLQSDLSRLLELQPGNLTARDLYDKLSTYAPGRPYRFDKDGKLLSAHRTPLLVLLGNTLRQSLRGYAQRQKYRDARGRRPPALPEPAPAGPRSPLVPVVIVLLVFALIALGIAILLRDGRQTIRVEIDDSVRAEDVSVLIDGDRLETAGLGETIKLRRGDHELEIKRGDVVAKTQDFRVVKGETTLLRISLEEEAVAARRAKPPAPPVRVARIAPKPAEAPPLAVAPFDESQAKEHQRAWADHLGVPVEITNSIGMRFVLIPPGEFMMGSSQTQMDRLLNDAEERDLPAWYVEDTRTESPQRHVQFGRAFYVGKYEVTIGEFREFVESTGYQTELEKSGEGGRGWNAAKEKWETAPQFTWRNRGIGDTDKHPVGINWTDAVEFCRWLSAKENATNRLPSEAEWEYACRAGTTTLWSHGDSEEGLEHVANVADAAFARRTHVTYARTWNDGHAFVAPVGQFRANAFGIHDMHGNVWEWCQDAYRPSYRDRSSPGRACRGGMCGNEPVNCRSAYRHGGSVRRAAEGNGFRVVCEIPDTPPKAPSKPSAEVKQPPTTFTRPSPREPTAPPAYAIAPFNETQAKQHQQSWANHLGAPVEKMNSIGMNLVLIPPGQFDMGSSEEEIEELLRHNEDGSNRFSSPELIRSEGPRHRVTITNPFYMGRHEVTVGQFRQFVEATGHKTSPGRDGQGAAGFSVATRRLEQGRDFTWENPGFTRSDSHPVASIGWDDATAFCAWLTREEGGSYRLPTEAEWEYACRAGTTTRWNSGNDTDALQGAGNIADTAFRLKCPNDRAWGASWDDGFPFTAPVGRFQPNAFGLHDMHGNVQEWCADWCDISYYQSGPVEDPCRLESPENSNERFSSHRIFRGGGMRDCALRCRSAGRAGLPPTWSDVNAGFRVVCEIEAKASPRHVAPEPAAQAAAPSGTVTSGRLVSIGPAEEVRLAARRVDFGDASLTCPAVTSDGLVIVFGVRHPDIPANVWMGERSKTQEPFGNATRLNDGGEPTIDGQGLEIVYVDHRRGARLMRRTRTSRDAQFGPPRPVFSDPPETTHVAPCLSEDGLRLLLCGGKTNDPAICTRRTRSEAWGTPTPFKVGVPGFDRRTPAFTGTQNELLVSVLGEEGPKHLAVVSSTDGGRTFADPKILQLQGTSGPVMVPRYCPATGEVFFQCFPGDSGSRIWKASLLSAPSRG